MIVTVLFSHLVYRILHQDWLVYVDQSKASLERGGVATLDAFMANLNEPAKEKKEQPKKYDQMSKYRNLLFVTKY